MLLKSMGDFNVPNSRVNLLSQAGNVFADKFRLATSTAWLEEQMQGVAVNAQRLLAFALNLFFLKPHALYRETLVRLTGPH